MKIDAGTIASSLLQPELNAKTASTATDTSTAPSHGVDRTTLSSDAASIKSLVSQAMATPDVRQAKVAQLKQAVSSGAYTVDTQKLATAMTADSAE